MKERRTITESEPKTLFNRWYVVPLKELEKLPDGDGGFVVLATCCFLYERYAKAYLKSLGHKANHVNLIAQLTRDFGTVQETAEVFWDVIRNGFLHQGMPKYKGRSNQPSRHWQTNGAFKVPVKLVKSPHREELQIQPWLFRDRVLELYEQRPDLIAYNESFPWASIWEDED